MSDRDHLGLRIGESTQFDWVSDPDFKPDMPHHVGHFFHPDCGYAVLTEVCPIPPDFVEQK